MIYLNLRKLGLPFMLLSFSSRAYASNMAALGGFILLSPVLVLLFVAVIWVVTKKFILKSISSTTYFLIVFPLSFVSAYIISTIIMLFNEYVWENLSLVFPTFAITLLIIVTNYFGVRMKVLASNRKIKKE